MYTGPPESVGSVGPWSDQNLGQAYFFCGVIAVCDPAMFGVVSPRSHMQAVCVQACDLLEVACRLAQCACVRREISPLIID